MTLWEGRISTGMADAVAAFTVSLPFDRVLAGDDLAGSRAHVKGLGKAGILSDSEVTTLVETLDIVEEEFATGAFVFAPGRRGHPHRHRAPGHRADRRRRGQAAHRAEPQRPGRHGAAPVVPPLAHRRGRGDHGAPGRAGAARPGGGRRLPARLHPHAAGAAGAAGAPPAGPRLGARPRRGPPPDHGRPPQHLAARRGRAGRIVAATRPRLRRRGARLPRPLRELPRCGLRSGLRGGGPLRHRAARRAPVPDGGGDRAVVDRGVRLLHARRRLRHRQLDAAAEEEPRRGRAGPGQVGPPHRPPQRRAGHAEGSPARLQPRPAGGQGAASSTP